MPTGIDQHTFRHSLVIIAAGVCAALHVGKLPPAFDILRDQFGLGFAQSGLLLSMIQLAGMTLGLAFGSWVDGLGSPRSMKLGLILLASASAVGALSSTPVFLLSWRAVEGAGFLLTVLAAPSWLRQTVAPARQPVVLALWGTYMPIGIALALLAGPPYVKAWGWPAWWLGVSILTFGAVGLLSRMAKAHPHPTVLTTYTRTAKPVDFEPRDAAHPSSPSWLVRLRETLSSLDPWLVALCFSAYSSQWLAVVGFMPTVYSSLGVNAVVAGQLTAVVCLANALGNVLGAALLQRGARPAALIVTGFAAMAVGSFFAFVHVGGSPLALPWRYTAVLMFSFIGGLIPSSLFAVAVRAAPSPGTLGSTVGWVQQWSALGQFVGPPLVGLIAATASGWQYTWVFSVLMSSVGAALAWQIARYLRQSPSVA